MKISDIRLADIKKRGGSFIIDEEVSKDIYEGTLYYYFDKYDDEKSYADVTVKYFPRGGAVILGPAKESDEGFEKLTKYIEKLSEEESIKNITRLRKLVDMVFILWQAVLFLLSVKNMYNAYTIGDYNIWKEVILDLLMLIAVRAISQFAKRF